MIEAAAFETHLLSERRRFVRRQRSEFGLRACNRAQDDAT